MHAPDIVADIGGILLLPELFFWTLAQGETQDFLCGFIRNGAVAPIGN